MTDEEKDEKIFELTQENAYLKSRITFLQEELASAEDTEDTLRNIIKTFNYE